MKQFRFFNLTFLISCLFLEFLISNFLFISSIHADSATLTVSPPVSEILIAPGKTVTQTFTLTYLGSEVDVIPELHRVKPSDSSGHVNIDPSPLSLSSLPFTITSSPSKLGESITTNSKSIPITLSFSASATTVPIDTYLALIFKAVGGDELMTSSRTTPGIAALILVSVSPLGVTPINLEIQDFSIPPIHDSWLPINIAPTIKNHVSTMIRPEGKFEIISPLGKTILTLPLYPNLVLGNSSRTLQSSIHELPGDLSWSPSWKEIGPFKLRLTITTISGIKLNEIERVVWILPIRLLIILTTLIFFIIAILKTTFKKNATIKSSLT